ncbi:MAG: NBR1-Ig-like domain-containing protein [Fimbriimonadaceae bacterium]|nr:NBR1-Ig-like domain-containing protein [Fimbriimonadaceae bacterium]
MHRDHFPISSVLALFAAVAITSAALVPTAHAQSPSAPVALPTPALRESAAVLTDGSLRIGTGINALRAALTGYQKGTAHRRAATATVRALPAETVIQQAEITQRYVVRRGGIHHAFTLAQRPAPSIAAGTLSFDLSLQGAQRIESIGEDTLQVTARQGVYQYAGLHAYDAAGAELPARFEVSGTRARILVDDATAQYPITIDPIWSETQLIPGPVTNSGSQFGLTVAVHEDVLAVAAIDRNEVTIYNRVAGAWIESQVIVPPAGTGSGQFGRTLALDAEKLLIGAPYVNVGTVTSAGKIFEYRKVGATWQLAHTILPPDIRTFGQFGNYMDLQGSYLIVGMPNWSVLDEPQAGAIVIYRRDPDGWTNVLYDTRGGLPSNTLHGSAVAIHGDWAVAVGSGANASTYLYRNTGGTWAYHSVLGAGHPSRHFLCVDMNEQTLVTGGSNTGFTGRVLNVFRLVAGTWTFSESLTAVAPYGVAGTFADRAVVDADRIYSASSGSFGPGITRYAITAFRQSGNVFPFEQHLHPYERSYNGTFGFGRGLAAQGPTVVAGWPDVNAVAGRSGAAVTFSYAPQLSIAFASSPVFASQTATLNVSLETPAPAGGQTVTLTAPGLPQLPPTVTVPAGSSTASVSFPVPYVKAGTRTEIVRAQAIGWSTAEATIAITGAYQSELVAATWPDEPIYRNVVYPVSLTVRNTGTATWSNATNDYLISANPDANSVWGPSLIRIPNGVTVAPGETHTFNFNVKAPALTGIQTASYRMRNGTTPGVSYGPHFNRVYSAIRNAANSQFVSGNVPAVVAANRPFNVQYTFRNNGSLNWVHNTHFLVSQNPYLNTTWGTSRRDLPVGAVILPNQATTVNLQLQAPATPGTYAMQWQFRRSGDAEFGERTPISSVLVVPGLDSAFVEQSIPTTMVRGTTASVTVTFRNTGAYAWKFGQHSLCSVNPFGTKQWGVVAPPMPAGTTVNYDGSVTFTFTIRAPQTPGTYNCQWQMRQSGQQNFGPTTPNVEITVT